MRQKGYLKKNLRQKEKEMNNYKKLEWIHFAIQEAINGNILELNQSLKYVEDLREEYIKGERDE